MSRRYQDIFTPIQPNSFPASNDGHPSTLERKLDPVVEIAFFTGRIVCSYNEGRVGESSNEKEGDPAMVVKEFLAPPGTSEAIIKSTFCVPPAKVFKAVIDPGQIPAWWGSERLSIKVKKMDVRKGG
jgi:hypothetical protein